MIPNIRLLLLSLAFVLFLVSAYLTADLSGRLERAAFAVLVLSYLLI
jgi:hypothetical protein